AKHRDVMQKLHQHGHHTWAITEVAPYYGNFVYTTTATPAVAATPMTSVAPVPATAGMASTYYRSVAPATASVAPVATPPAAVWTTTTPAPSPAAKIRSGDGWEWRLDRLPNEVQ